MATRRYSLKLKVRNGGFHWQSMRSKRIRVEKEVADGWSRWVQPVMKGYLLACCDCSLVHRLDFRIHKGRIQFKAQRAPRYTARERARRGK